MSRLVMILMATLALGCDEAECAGVEPTEVTLVASSVDECTEMGLSAWEAVGLWRSHGVPLSLADCLVEPGYPRDVFVDGELPVGLDPGEGIVVYAVDSIEIVRESGVETPRGFMGVIELPACGSIGAVVHDAEALLVAHELGHAVGLEHSDDPESLMFPTPGSVVDEVDAESARANLGVCGG